MKNTMTMDTPVGTIVTEVSHSPNSEFYDVYIDLRRGDSDMQVCVVTVDDRGIHIYPYNTKSDDESDCATDDLIVHTDGDRWF